MSGYSGTPLVRKLGIRAGMRVQLLAAARAGMAEDEMVWVSWPKKDSGVASELGRAEVMAAGKAAGLVDVKVCAVDETWSGLKFVIPVADRRVGRVRS